MEKKQGFFSALKEEVKRGLSPARSRGRSKGRHVPALPEPVVVRSGGLRHVEALSPLMEGPDQNEGMDGGDYSKVERWGNWMKGQFFRSPAAGGGGGEYQRSDLRLLIGVLGAPLAPVHVSSSEPLPHLSIKNSPIVSFPLISLLSCYIASFTYLLLGNNMGN